MDQLPSTQIGSDDQFAELAKSADYLGRLTLFTKGKAVNKRLVGPGNYGIPTGEEVDDLGDTIDIVPLARRPKALDMTDNEAIIANYDPDSDEFKRIAAKSLEKESHCMYGPRSSSSSDPAACSWSSSAATSPTAAKPRRSTPTCR